MADSQFFDDVTAALCALRDEGLLKPERVLSTPQAADIATPAGPAINLCANNYLGLANDRRVKAAAIEAVEQWGAGLASVRFICGTQGIHKQLERATADYLGFEDSILFAAAFDANGGVFEPLLGENDAIVSDSLNHASIIDGVRLCKAKRYRFANSDMADLDRQLTKARADGAKHILIATDGAFSMDGYVANLSAVTDLADIHGALVMVDDCHATGVLGERGRGSAAHCGVEGRIDILTGTYGKALGGAMGGFVAARQPVIDLLRQRARPYLFSNALAPSICGAALAAIAISNSNEGDRLRAKLAANAARFRTAMTAAGFRLLEGNHPIIPVMLDDAALAQRMAARLLEEGIYVTAFSFPVVPRGLARIRVQMSAGLEDHHIDKAVAAFIKVGRELGVVQ
ncbi:PLP-dependent aspartate aminotransferase family protein [Sphingomonas sp. 28-63-12]|uniref:glycine C-acetyltransferase n=1 Tax=Sphingomonas sp. 28-63-12 TaxID=1970434 RepID=UPI000BDC5C8D|nr:MAG: glycine C-acetyltransferase [Sphingomonas sp. 28-63-12]